MKKKRIRVILVMVLIALVVLGGYYVISNHLDTGKDDVEIPTTEVEKILAKDLEIDYPATPKEVVKLYGRISKSFYEKEYNDEQYKQLVGMFRNLLDDELLANNEEEQYYVDLDEKIKEFSESKRTITNYFIPDNAKLNYYTKEGKKYATLPMTYTIRDNGTILSTTEQFMLRQDKSEKWKILGWKLADR